MGRGSKNYATYQTNRIMEERLKTNPENVVIKLRK